MNLRTEFFLALKYLRPKRNAVSVITCISIVGVTLGVAVLLVVLAVMTGFTNLMKDKLMQTGAHIQVYSAFRGCILSQTVRSLILGLGHPLPPL